VATRPPRPSRSCRSFVPFKANPKGPRAPRPKAHHVHALPERAALEIRFPRVEGYRQAIRSRVRVDWARMPRLLLDPKSIPPEIEMKAAIPTNRGRHGLLTRDGSKASR
jgi:hypothetical protein